MSVSNIKECVAECGFFSNAWYCGGIKGDQGEIVPKEEKARVIVHVRSSLISGCGDERVEVVLRDLGFTEGALQRIYSYLGDGDIEEGKNELFDLIDDRVITVERVGFSKPKKSSDGKSLPPEAKFYLMINKVNAEGGNNTFHIGFSRQGTPRGINRSFKADRDVSKLVQNLSKKETFHEHVHASKRCSSVMNHEPGVKVSQLGRADLAKFDIVALSKSRRLRLYMSIIQGLNTIHKLGVHQDVKPLNIVVDDDDLTMFIDFDTMKPKNVEANSISGTLIYYSPERLRCVINDYLYPNKDHRWFTNEKDDMWAAMLSICQIEARVPEKERLLSSAWIQKAKEYREAIRHCDQLIKKVIKKNKPEDHHKLSDSIKSIKIMLDSLDESGHLFKGLEGELNRPLDPLVYQLAHVKPQERYTAAAVLMNFAHLESLLAEEEGILASIKKTILGRLFQ